MEVVNNQAQLKKQIEENEKYKNQIDHMMRTTDSFKSQLEEAKLKMEQSESENKELNLLNKGLQNNLSQSQTLTDTQAIEINNLKEDKMNLEIEIEELGVRSTDLDDELAVVNIKFDALKKSADAEIESLKKKCEKLK